VVRAPHDVLAAALFAPRTAARVAALIDGWIEALYRACAAAMGASGSDDGGAGPGTLLRPGREIECAQRTVVRPNGRVGWVLHLSGHSLLQGQAGAVIGDGDDSGYFPLAGAAWLEAQPGSHLYAADTASLTSATAILAGTARLARIVWDRLAAGAEERQRTLAVRAEGAAGRDRDVVARACARLAATTLPERDRSRALGQLADPLREGPEDELFACVRLVSAALGIAVKAPARGEGTDGQRDRLAPLLRGAGLRARRVTLREDWWRSDHGPLLATRAADQQPVALLRDGRGYVIHTADGAATPLDASSAETLAPFAHTFYAPLPSRRLDLSSIVRFAARGSAGDLAVLVFMALLVALLGMVPSAAVGVLFNEVIPGAHRAQLQQMTIILVVCAVSSAGFGLVRGLALLRLQQRMSTTLQAAVWDRLLRLPLSFFRPFTAGELANRAMAVDAIQQVLSGTTITAILAGVFSLANLVMMFHHSTAMAWRALLLMGIAVLVTAIGGLLQLRPQRAATRLQAKTSGLVLQLLTSIAKLRVAAAEARAFSLWGDQFAQQRRLQLGRRRVENWLTAFSAAFPTLAYVLIYWAALPLLGRGEEPLHPGAFMAFGASFSACLSAVLATTMALVAALAVIPLYEQAKPILENQPEVDEARVNPGPLAGGIEIENATFRYHRDAAPALRDITLKVRPGEFVALVGPSGSGKSTLLRLLLGFEKLESGAIYYDGQDLGSLDVQAVRRQLGVVLQSGNLIPGDLFTNIVGSTNCSLEEAWAAAAVANIADDIKAMPMQMHTVVGEGASTLSGGQRQRLMIARAVVNRPRLLLFDEATSALDNRTQALVSKSLEEMKATRIVVAHRLSTIVNADRIVVIDGGRIVESGTHDELVARNGLFAQLVRRQMV
jgi:ATP-binding cassette subfamily C protein